MSIRSPCRCHTIVTDWCAHRMDVIALSRRARPGSANTTVKLSATDILRDPKAEEYLTDSIRAAMTNVRRRTNAPFGAVIVRQGKVIATAVNEVDDFCDPTAHADSDC
jgi:deoxycytidylate deaminase